MLGFSVEEGGKELARNRFTAEQIIVKLRVRHTM